MVCVFFPLGSYTVAKFHRFIVSPFSWTREVYWMIGKKEVYQILIYASEPNFRNSQNCPDPLLPSEKLLHNSSEECSRLGSWSNMDFQGHSGLALINIKWTWNCVSISLPALKTFSIRLFSGGSSAERTRKKYWQNVDRKKICKIDQREILLVKGSWKMLWDI